MAVQFTRGLGGESQHHFWGDNEDNRAPGTKRGADFADFASMVRAYKIRDPALTDKQVIADAATYLRGEAHLTWVHEETVSDTGTTGHTVESFLAMLRGLATSVPGPEDIDAALRTMRLAPTKDEANNMHRHLTRVLGESLSYIKKAVQRNTKDDPDPALPDLTTGGDSYERRIDEAIRSLTVQLAAKPESLEQLADPDGNPAVAKAILQQFREAVEESDMAFLARIDKKARKRQAVNVTFELTKLLGASFANDREAFLRIAVPKDKDKRPENFKELLDKLQDAQFGQKQKKTSKPSKPTGKPAALYLLDAEESDYSDTEQFTIRQGFSGSEDDEETPANDPGTYETRGHTARGDTARARVCEYCGNYGHRTDDCPDNGRSPVHLDF